MASAGVGELERAVKHYAICVTYLQGL